AVCVTNDSGSMHLAVALGRPVVSVFGPTDPVWIGPYGRPHAVVRADVPCAPCYLRRLRSCPYGHACMNEVTAEQVIERLEQILPATALPPAGCPAASLPPVPAAVTAATLVVPRPQPGGLPCPAGGQSAAGGAEVVAPEPEPVAGRHAGDVGG